MPNIAPKSCAGSYKQCALGEIICTAPANILVPLASQTQRKSKTLASMLALTVVALFALATPALSLYTTKPPAPPSTTTTQTTAPPTTHDCPDCYQKPHPPNEHYAPRGACCYGDQCISSNKTLNACEILGFVWAGPWSDCGKCRHLAPCCLPLAQTENSAALANYDNSPPLHIFGDYQCTHEVCFDCVKKGGTIVEFCEECGDLTTTTAPPTTTGTGNTKPTTTTGTGTTGTTGPTPAPTPDKPTGACCAYDGQCVDYVTAWECNEKHNGAYRGDHSHCADADICKPICCDPVENQCIDADTKERCEIANGVSLGFGQCVTQEGSCGGACCIDGKASTSRSEEECEACDGTFLGFGVPAIDELCPRACCVPDETVSTGFSCELRTVESCNDEDDAVLHPVGTGCSVDPCGGACCSEDESGEPLCEFLLTDPSGLDAEAQCKAKQTDVVYQGDGSSCFAEADGDVELENNGACLNDGACCIPPEQPAPTPAPSGYGSHAPTMAPPPSEGTCERATGVKECLALGGTFQGIGSRCEGEESISCTNRACCFDAGCLNLDSENAELECKLKGGSLAPYGTHCGQPGVCDTDSGACCCDGHCINAPDSDWCREYGGPHASFRGHGSSCDRDGVCDIPEEEGACCIKRSYLKDGDELCVMVHNAPSCAFRGGHWQGTGTSCFDDEGVCRELLGACCVGDQVYDELSAEECAECGGHWAGAGSKSGDEGVCDPRHKGACCRRGRGCEETTYVQCKRDGGHYQGPESSCSDDLVCTACLPCETDAQDCDYDEDCPSGTKCIQAYGKCMAPATRIPALHYGAKPPGYAEVSAKLAGAGASRKREIDQTEEPVSEEENDDDHHYHTGPYTCGGAETIGQPCILHPCQGKCAVGTCKAPPAGFLSESCESVCVKVHEYPCECECKDPWYETCAHVNGRVVNDTNTDGIAEESEPGLQNIDVLLHLISPDADEPTYIATTKSGANGHYAFAGLAGGTYNVTANVTAPYAVSGGPTRIVSLECIPDEDLPADDRKRSVVMRVQHRDMGNHIADDVNFPVRKSHMSDGNGNGGAPTPAPTMSNGDGPSTALVLGILFGVLALAICLFVAAVLGSRGPARVRRR